MFWDNPTQMLLFYGREKSNEYGFLTRNVALTCVGESSCGGEDGDRALTQTHKMVLVVPLSSQPSVPAVSVPLLPSAGFSLYESSWYESVQMQEQLPCITR